jgi:hypothetical protein
VVVVCKAGPKECAHLVEDYNGTVRAVADEDERISLLFGIEAVPTAVLINPDGRIRSYGNPMRASELEAMMDDGSSGGRP